MALTLEQRAAQIRAGGRDDSFAAYSSCPHFARRTSRGRVQWMLLHRDWMRELGHADNTDLAQVIAAEGWADSDEEAWAAAVAAAGTDQLYLNTAGQLSHITSIRAEQLRQQRWAAKRPEAENASAVRYVYSYNPSDYYQGQDPYPYRRHRILKETAKFLFVDASSFGEPINADGEPMPDRRVFSGRTGTSYRVRKTAFQESDEYKPLGCAAMGRYDTVWLELAQLVAYVRSRVPQSAAVSGGEWREVLGLPVGEHLELPVVQRAYRRRLLQVHPDHGGSREQFEAVQAAYAQAKRLVSAG